MKYKPDIDDLELLTPAEAMALYPKAVAAVKLKLAVEDMRVDATGVTLVHSFGIDDSEVLWNFWILRDSETTLIMMDYWTGSSWVVCNT